MQIGRLVLLFFPPSPSFFAIGLPFILWLFFCRSPEILIPEEELSDCVVCCPLVLLQFSARSDTTPTIQPGRNGIRTHKSIRLCTERCRDGYTDAERERGRYIVKRASLPMEIGVTSSKGLLPFPRRPPPHCCVCLPAAGQFLIWRLNAYFNIIIWQVVSSRRNRQNLREWQSFQFGNRLVKLLWERGSLCAASAECLSTMWAGPLTSPLTFTHLDS